MPDSDGGGTRFGTASMTSATRTEISLSLSARQVIQRLLGWIHRLKLSQRGFSNRDGLKITGRMTAPSAAAAANKGGSSSVAMKSEAGNPH